MFKCLNPILHSQLRLAVMSLLISVKEAEFTYLRENTNATAGNLSFFTEVMVTRLIVVTWFQMTRPKALAI